MAEKQSRDSKGRFLPVEHPKTEIMKVTREEKNLIQKLRRTLS